MWLLAYAVMSTFIIWALSEIPTRPFLPEMSAALERICVILLLGGAVLSLGKLIYEMLYYRFYYYGIEGGHLVVSTGILLKQRGVFPLNTITDVYLDRNLLDYFFGIYNLYTSNPAGISHKYSDIHGLSKPNAVALQDYLVTLTRQVSPKIENLVKDNPPALQPA
jgi:membrane protein YdbS with pleckstrin-like domain